MDGFNLSIAKNVSVEQRLFTCYEKSKTVIEQTILPVLVFHVRRIIQTWPKFPFFIWLFFLVFLSFCFPIFFSYEEKTHCSIFVTHLLKSFFCVTPLTVPVPLEHSPIFCFYILFFLWCIIFLAEVETSSLFQNSPTYFFFFHTSSSCTNVLLLSLNFIFFVLNFSWRFLPILLTLRRFYKAQIKPLGNSIPRASSNVVSICSTRTIPVSIK